MNATPQVMRRLALRILDLERAAQLPGSSPGAGFGVCDKLRTSLSALAGVAGFRSLLSRALILAHAEVDWLKVITVTPDGSLLGLEVEAGLPQDEVDRGETILIAQLVGLLITFIGEALTLRLLQEAWPEVSRRDMDTGLETE